MKIAVIGGGSTYTPELVEGLAGEQARLELTELWLMDVDAARLAVVAAMAQRMLAGSPIAVHATTDQGQALREADAVLIQLRVGGQAARLQDELFPLACGCLGQETTGAGGLAKALRTVPLVLEIATEAQRLARPEAWIINFTNPVGIVTRALLDGGHRTVGLCNVAIGVQRWLAQTYGVPPQSVAVDQFGLNHLSWFFRLLVEGRDVLPELIATEAEQLARRAGVEADLIQGLGLLPSYYLSYYYGHNQAVERARRERPRALAVVDLEAGLLAAYADPATLTKPEALARRGGAYYSAAAAELLVSLLAPSGSANRLVVNVRNGTTLAGLAADDVIETACLVGADGVQPLPLPAAPPAILGLIQHVSAYERLAVAAALTGSRQAVRMALLAHPLVGQWSLANQLEALTLATSRPYLPRFEAQVAPGAWPAERRFSWSEPAGGAVAR